MPVKNENSFKNDRRDFILKTVSSCALCCFAVPFSIASEKEMIPTETDQQHKFQSDSGMSIQRAFNFAYKEWYIPAMKNLMVQIGKDKFLSMLRRSSEMLYEKDNKAEINYEERTLAALTALLKRYNEAWKDRLTLEIIQENEDVFEVKYTECLWAKTFREANASEIGYEGICYQDYPTVKQFNPDITLIREKTLMQGDDCCHFKFVRKA